MRSNGLRPATIFCRGCGKTKQVAPKGRVPWFCSPECNNDYQLAVRRKRTRLKLADWECVLCGTKMAVPHGQQRYCSRSCVHRVAKLRDYRLTASAFVELARAQEWKCAICSNGGTRGYAVRKLVVDHCHNTGLIRGLLCRTCNTGIGHLRDDVALVQRALDYLIDH